MRLLADRIVLCSLRRADGSVSAQAESDRLQRVLVIRFFRTSGRLLFEEDGAYPATSRTEGAQVRCGSAAYMAIGRRYWPGTIRWRLGKTPSDLPRAQVVSALRAAQSEWTNNINWCGYPDRADGFALYEGSTSSQYGHDGRNTVDWGSIANIQGCAAAIACAMTWYDGQGTPVESDVRFRDRDQWSLRPRADAYDIQSLAAHEFGHVRQFGHVTSVSRRDITLVMWPVFAAGDISRRKLGRGDSLADNKYY